MPDTRPIVSDGLPDMSDFPPVYLYKDAEGRDYTLQVPSVDAAERPHGRGNGLGKRYLVAEDRALLARTKLKVKYLPDLDLEAAADKANKIGCNGTLPPISYTMFGNGGEHSVGSVAICKINVARPPNSHTHWIQLIVATYRVASNQVHVPVVAWFKPELHGHGMYFGDTSFFSMRQQRPIRRQQHPYRSLVAVAGLPATHPNESILAVHRPVLFRYLWDGMVGHAHKHRWHNSGHWTTISGNSACQRWPSGDVFGRQARWGRFLASPYRSALEERDLRYELASQSLLRAGLRPVRSRGPRSGSDRRHVSRHLR